MISIIIPVLNEQQNISVCLQSLQDWRQQGCEIIVVDGGSTDRSREIAGRQADILCDSERGRAVQMNTGAARAGGDILLFLHADTILPPVSEVLIDTINRQEHGWGRFDVRLSGAQPAFRIIGFFMNLRSRITGIATGDQAMFVCRQLFSRIGGFPRIPLMEDIALSRKLRAMSRPLCLQQQAVTSSRRWESHGVTRTVLLMWSLRIAYFAGIRPERLARLYASR